MMKKVFLFIFILLGLPSCIQNSNEPEEIRTSEFSKSIYQAGGITICGNMYFPEIHQEYNDFSIRFCANGKEFHHIGRDIASWWSELVPQGQILNPSYFGESCNDRSSDLQGSPSPVFFTHLFYSHNRVQLDWTFKWCHKYKIYSKSDDGPWRLLTVINNSSGNGSLSYEYFIDFWIPPFGTFAFPNQVSYKIVTENFDKYSVESNILTVYPNEIGPGGIHIFPRLYVSPNY
jgi:hypothetical protein